MTLLEGVLIPKLLSIPRAYISFLSLVIYCAKFHHCRISWAAPKNPILNRVKRQKNSTITNAFQNTLGESNSKANKKRVDESSEICNSSMKSCQQNNDIKMYSVHNETKSLAAERFIIILKNKIYKYMNSITDNFHIENLSEIVSKYIDTYYSTIKMKTEFIRKTICWMERLR